MQIQYSENGRSCAIWLEQAEARGYRDEPEFLEIFWRCSNAGLTVSVFIRH